MRVRQGEVTPTVTSQKEQLMNSKPIDSTPVPVTQTEQPTCPTDACPITTMSRWSLKQIHWASGHRTRHLVGRAWNMGRVGSIVEHIDLDSMTVTARNGRRYRLMGAPGRDRQGRLVFRQWLDTQPPAHVRDMTRALLRLRRIRKLSPYWYEIALNLLGGP